MLHVVLLVLIHHVDGVVVGARALLLLHHGEGVDDHHRLHIHQVAGLTGPLHGLRVDAGLLLVALGNERLHLLVLRLQLTHQRRYRQRRAVVRQGLQLQLLYELGDVGRLQLVVLAGAHLIVAHGLQHARCGLLLRSGAHAAQRLDHGTEADVRVVAHLVGLGYLLRQRTARDGAVGLVLGLHGGHQSRVLTRDHRRAVLPQFGHDERLDALLKPLHPREVGGVGSVARLVDKGIDLMKSCSCHIVLRLIVSRFFSTNPDFRGVNPSSEPRAVLHRSGRASFLPRNADFRIGRASFLPRNADFRIGRAVFSPRAADFRSGNPCFLPRAELLRPVGALLSRHRRHRSRRFFSFPIHYIYIRAREGAVRKPGRHELGRRSPYCSCTNCR